MVTLPYLSKALIYRLVLGLLGGTLFFIFWVVSWRFPSGFTGSEELRIAFYDVGQGDAMLIQQGDTQVLIDGGPNAEVLSAIGRDIPPWDRTIELVVLTHPHADHLTGLTPVFERYKVEKILYYPSTYETKGYERLLEAVKNEKTEVFYAQAGGQITLGKLTLQIVWPTDNYHDENVNNESVVLLLNYADFEALLLGDAQQEAQENLLLSIDDVEVLKVAHHGSWNGVYEPLLQIASPRLAIISVGAGNRYGHPHQGALNLLAKLGIPVLRTDLSGDIIVKTDGQRFWYTTAR